MREPPALPQATIRAALAEHYGRAGAALTFLPLGNDSASWVYRADAPGGRPCFLKVRAGAEFSPPSLTVPHYLRGQGLAEVLAPLPTASGTLWAEAGGFVLSLHPLIEGHPAAHTGLSEQHWRALGALLRRIHTCPLPPALRQTLRCEPVAPARHGRIGAVEAALAARAAADPLVRALADCWQAHRAAIHSLAAQVDALGARLLQRGAAPVLCHADLHTWNVLLDADQRLWLIDWDYTLLALPERDLLFIAGGVGPALARPREIACFLEGYGQAADQRALAYYRASMAVQNLIEYGTRIQDARRFGQITRAEFVQGFQQMFAPAQIVELAFEGLAVDAPID